MKTTRDLQRWLGVRPPVAAEGTGTRERVARSILENGPSTAAALARRLEITPAAIRRHLDVLLADGMIEVRQPRVYGHRSRGRPAKVFALSSAGRDAFEQSYDALAVNALRFMAEHGGEEMIAQFARRQIADLERRYRPLIEATPADRRVEVLAQALNTEGYAATAQAAPVSGEQICQHHCPVAHVAGEFPQLCEAETEMFASLLGTHVQRLATIAHGDGVCTTHVPGPVAADGRVTPATLAPTAPVTSTTGNPSERTTA